MFNSREYERSDVNVVAAGRPVTGIRGVKYSSKQEKEVLHAKGNKPHSIQRGNKTYDGELTVTQSEYEALRAAGGGIRQPEQGRRDNDGPADGRGVHGGQHGMEAGRQVPGEGTAVYLP